MILDKMPEGVIPFDAVVCICFMEIGDLPLLQKNNSHPLYGGLCGFPAGKVKDDETPLLAARRELEEETGNILPLKDITPVHIIPCKHEVKNLKLHFNCHLFWVEKSLKHIKINPEEHRGAIFVQEQDLFFMDPELLMPDFLETFKIACRIRY